MVLSSSTTRIWARGLFPEVAALGIQLVVISKVLVYSKKFFGQLSRKRVILARTIAPAGIAPKKFLHLDLNQGRRRGHDYNISKITDQEEILWQSGRSSK
jgi:hypothetical protein